MTFPIGTGDIAPLMDSLETMLPGFVQFLIYVTVTTLGLVIVIPAVRAGIRAVRGALLSAFGRTRRARR